MLLSSKTKDFHCSSRSLDLLHLFYVFRTIFKDLNLYISVINFTGKQVCGAPHPLILSPKWNSPSSKMFNYSEKNYVPRWRNYTN